MTSIGRPVRVTVRDDVVFRPGRRRLADRLPPRPAFALATLVVDAGGTSGGFVGRPGAPPYAAEAVATCAAGGGHPVPEPGCRCGFAAAASLEELLVLTGPPVVQTAWASAVLDVELGGRELEGPRGVRAAQQRVLAAAFVPICHGCTVQEGRVFPAVALAGLAPVQRAAIWPVAPVCEAHGRALGSQRVWSLATVTGLVRAEVSWARATVIDALFAGAARAARPAVRPVVVAQLAMGQVGYVDAAAVQVSADGSVWIDVAAPAPLRCRRADRVPVRRMADLRLEVWTDALGVHGRVPPPSALAEPPVSGLAPVAAVHGPCRCSPSVPCDAAGA